MNHLVVRKKQANKHQCHTHLLGLAGHVYGHRGTPLRKLMRVHLYAYAPLPVQHKDKAPRYTSTNKNKDNSMQFEQQFSITDGSYTIIKQTNSFLIHCYCEAVIIDKGLNMDHIKLLY